MLVHHLLRSHYNFAFLGAYILFGIAWTACYITKGVTLKNETVSSNNSNKMVVNTSGYIFFGLEGIKGKPQSSGRKNVSSVGMNCG